MNRATRKFLKFFIGAIVLFGAFFAMFYAMSGDPKVDESGSTADDWAIGNTESEIVIIEYSDLQCPACAAREPLVDEIVSEFGNHVKFVYRHFPLRTLHKNAQFAAEAAEAAGLQGKFWEMKEVLFANQQAWSTLEKEPAEAAFGLYAAQIGLDPAKFTQDLASDAVKDAVNEDYAKGVDARVNSTPTFFLNGQQMDFFDKNEIRTLLKTTIENGK
ncbi:thioredoxin domain-containing protein [Candidatus Gracilibacteria bacterium]|nr:thioredoxin domain-containing protein [Candidatus Gracilibacteria bacterium]